MMHLQHLHLIFVEDERVDWNMSAQAIHNHIRGLSPWPVAYTTMNEKNLKLFSAFIVKGKKVIQEQLLKLLSMNSS